MLENDPDFSREYMDHAYVNDRSIIANIFKNYCKNRNMTDSKFYETIRSEMINFHRDLPHNPKHTKKNFNAAYGDGVRNLFEKLNNLKLFERLNKDVNSVIDSSVFLWEVTTYAAESKLLVVDTFLPFSEMSYYLLEEFDSLVKKYMETENVDHQGKIVSARSALHKVLEGISKVCQYKYNKIKDVKEGNETFYREFLSSDFLASVLPRHLEKFDKAAKLFHELIETVFSANKALKDNEEFKNHIYMADHYLLTLRSMVYAIISIKGYNETTTSYMGIRRPYTHHLSKSLSAVATNIFMFVIGKNDNYYDGVRKRIGMATVWMHHSHVPENPRSEKWYEFTANAKKIQNLILENTAELKKKYDESKLKEYVEAANGKIKDLENQLDQFQGSEKEELTKMLDEIKSLPDSFSKHDIPKKVEQMVEHTIPEVVKQMVEPTIPEMVKPKDDKMDLLVILLVIGSLVLLLCLTIYGLMHAGKF